MNCPIPIKIIYGKHTLIRVHIHIHLPNDSVLHTTNENLQLIVFYLF